MAADIGNADPLGLYAAVVRSTNNDLQKQGIPFLNNQLYTISNLPELTTVSALASQQGQTLSKSKQQLVDKAYRRIREAFDLIPPEDQPQAFAYSALLQQTGNIDTTLPPRPAQPARTMAANDDDAGIVLTQAQQAQQAQAAQAIPTGRYATAGLPNKLGGSLLGKADLATAMNAASAAIQSGAVTDADYNVLAGALVNAPKGSVTPDDRKKARSLLTHMKRAITEGDVNQRLADANKTFLPTVTDPKSSYGWKTTKQFVKSSPQGVAQYGPTAGTATAAQLKQRALDGYHGHGAYWGNALGSKIPYIGKWAGKALSEAEDMVLDRAAAALADYRSGARIPFKGNGAYMSYKEPSRYATDMLAMDDGLGGMADDADVGGASYYTVDEQGDDLTNAYGRAPLRGNGGYFGQMLGSAIPGIGGIAGPLLGAIPDEQLAGAAIGGAQKLIGAIRGNGAYRGVMPPGGLRGSGAYELEGASQMKRGRSEAQPQTTPAINLTVNVDADDTRNVKTNQLVNPGNPFARRPPEIRSSNDETGSVTFRHKEYLSDVTPTSADFQTQAVLNINAGLANSFPLLSRFAAYFEEYRFTQLVFYYRTLVTSGNGTANGSVMMTTSYNPSSSQFYSKRAVENSEFSASGLVTDTIVMGVECDGRKNAISPILYNRYGKLPDTADLHSYDMGFVQVCTQGAVPNLVIGELWVEYECVLGKLRNTSSVPLAISEGYSIATLSGRNSVQTALTYCLLAANDNGIVNSLPGIDWVGQLKSDGTVSTPPAYWQVPHSGANLLCFSQSPNMTLNYTPTAQGTDQVYTIQFQSVAMGVYCLQWAYQAMTAADVPLAGGAGQMKVQIIGGNATMVPSNGQCDFVRTAQPSTAIDLGQPGGFFTTYRSQCVITASGQSGSQMILRISFVAASADNAQTGAVQYVPVIGHGLTRFS